MTAITPVSSPLPAIGAVTATAWALPEGMTEAEWRAAGETLTRLREASLWWLGDWWAFGEHRYGNRKALVESSEWEGPAFQSCANAASVCTAFGTSRRREVLSFGHHEAVAALAPDDADQLLDWAQATHASRDALRGRVAEVNRQIGPKPKRKPLPRVAKPAVATARGEVVEVDALPATEAPTFNRTNDSVDWAWWTWNPVTGCLHDCPYCYARDIANQRYPQKFVPTFHADRLTAPANMPRPTSDDPRSRRVFTCSMADLFGKWVPQEWIDAVFSQVRDHQEWEFLFLTKFPQRLAELKWPDNAWVGTTVDRQHRVEIAERAFRGVKAGVKWLSCEPLLEPLRFTSLGMFDLVVIGGASRSTQTPEFWPPYEWVRDLERQARDAGCHVFFKANALSSSTPVPKELPRTRGEGA